MNQGRLKTFQSTLWHRLTCRTVSKTDLIHYNQALSFHSQTSMPKRPFKTVLTAFTLAALSACSLVKYQPVATINKIDMNQGYRFETSQFRARRRWATACWNSFSSKKSASAAKANR